jgi:cytochrome c peroxidase
MTRPHAVLACLGSLLVLGGTLVGCEASTGSDGSNRTDGEAADASRGPDTGSTPAPDAGDASAEGGGCEAILGLSASDCQRVQALQLPAALPPALGNKYGDDEAAARLGFQLFFDSNIGTGVSCATCHSPDLAFTDRLSVSTGKSVGTRNAFTVYNAARLSVIFWDGRADSLWSQPLFAIENPLEMGSTRLALAHLVASDASLLPMYENTFGPMSDISQLPATGMPGQASFDGLTAEQQDTVDRIAANAGKALQAYLRLNTSGPAPIDAYLSGNSAAIIDLAKKGLSLFVTSGCIDCHSGPMLTDQGFHDVSFPSLPNANHDPGRADALAILDVNVFNLQGPYADPPTTGGTFVPPPEPSNPDGAFRTPPLRNVTETGPYGHDGALVSLDDVLAVHASPLSLADQGAIIAFLQTLLGQTPPLPWSTWPTPQ